MFNVHLRGSNASYDYSAGIIVKVVLSIIRCVEIQP